ncbi:hypothetical protein ETD86_01260 [Nonomuraea turkmeniaca]|uniref:CBM2 domain-containing protein n=1 Tax=Nonomuraea turkmeniaca TaxID=103838 RepID=A0A5S4FXF7_9ACTN|nr:hypothetical protein [Nonomuraea turkmeniaca]TMR25507.1 hypothetical protein ETD86_01260 [Nonomuraea turkmeniaca]
MPGEGPGFFGGQSPGGTPGPFDGPDGRNGFFDGPDERHGFFDGPDDRDGGFGGPDDRTAGFDQTQGFGAGSISPPEPGDIKVAGEPTAVQTPAWAETETGFLGSGWSNDSGLDEPDERKGRRGRRKGGRGGGGGGGRGDGELLAPSSGAGKGRVALLSVAAVAIVLGGTVAGVKLMSSSGAPAKCEGTTCAAAQTASGQPDPAVSDPAPEETEPEEDTAAEEETTPSDTPTPTASYAPRTPRRTTSATPTPTPAKTKVKKSTAPTPTPTQSSEAPVEEGVTISPSENPSPVDDGTPTVGVTPDPTSGAGTFNSGGSGASVNIRQTISQRLTTYRADMTLSNTSQEQLDRPTVSVPVDGRVVSVSGAEWTQDGDLLILDLAGTLAAGDSANVSFTATGRGQEAETCGMVTGECSIS